MREKNYNIENEDIAEGFSREVRRQKCILGESSTKSRKGYKSPHQGIFFLSRIYPVLKRYVFKGI